MTLFCHDSWKETNIYTLYLLIQTLVCKIFASSDTKLLRIICYHEALFVTSPLYEMQKSLMFFTFS